MLKIAIVGIGGISAVHINGWKKVEDAQIVAMCDVRAEKVDPAATEAKAKAYYDLDTMLAEETFDVLDICTPTYLHKDHALKGMTSGHHVLVEKPISLHKEDVEILYRKAAECGVKFMVAHVIRFWNEYCVLKKYIDNHTFGKVLSGNFYRLSEVPRWSWDNWMSDSSRSGLVPFDLHIHDLDFMVYVFGKPKIVHSFRGRGENQDYIHAIYDYGDFFISGEASWFNCPYPFKNGFRVQFENGIIEYADGVVTLYKKDGEKEILQADNQGADTGINVPTNDAYGTEIQYFADCVAQKISADKVKPDELVTVLDLIAQL